MKIAIVYYSQHHGNTKKLIDAIMEQNQSISPSHEITLIDVTTDTTKDLTEYDIIGFASGIYFSKYNDKVTEYAKTQLPKGKKVFLLYTYGNGRSSYTKDISQKITENECEIVGIYGCNGFDTYGPFKIVGGLNKNHPDEQDIAGAVEFFNSLV